MRELAVVVVLILTLAVAYAVAVGHVTDLSWFPLVLPSLLWREGPDDLGN